MFEFFVKSVDYFAFVMYTENAREGSLRAYGN
jgi:hypothetical protein